MEASAPSIFVRLISLSMSQVENTRPLPDDFFCQAEFPEIRVQLVKLYEILSPFESVNVVFMACLS